MIWFKGDWINSWHDSSSVDGGEEYGDDDDDDLYVTKAPVYVWKN